VPSLTFLKSTDPSYGASADILMSHYTMQNFNFSFQMISVSKTVVTSTALLTFFDNEADDAIVHANRSRG
jgi:hypothetical protein